jgi:hypothetical protein
MTEHYSPSTSHKGSLDSPLRLNPDEQEQGDHEVIFVNPCHAAPPLFAELQPFSSRQSRSGNKEVSSVWPTIHEHRHEFERAHDEKVCQDVEDRNQGGDAGDEKEGERVMSKTKMFLTALGMCLTYFLGVSSFLVLHCGCDKMLICQTASSASVTLMIPDIARTLQVSELSAQWVASAYSLAYGW